MKRIYIAGPITGVKGAKQIFKNASEKLTNEGYIAVNPFDNGIEESASWRDHMKADIKMLMDCDAIYLLDGYRNSKGAMIEYDLARILGLEIIGN